MNELKNTSRITPAYAGKTTAHIAECLIMKDHPRIRGKDDETLRKKTGKSGSPPHTRERLVPFPVIFSFLGITPAYAGKTQPQSRCYPFAEDHPRIRGKDSPNEEMLVLVLWITPAYAGKTRSLLHIHLRRQDHPRIRGKDFLFPSMTATHIGSPPHTRERRFQFSSTSPPGRITPAYAGKTLREFSYQTEEEDHPRIRGKDSYDP